jgi:hypothetical protein
LVEINSSVVRLSRAPVYQLSRRYLRHGTFHGDPQFKKYTFDTASDTIRDIAEQRPAAAGRFRPAFKDVTSFGYPIDLASCQNDNTRPSFLRRATWTNEKSSAKALSRSARKNNATGCCTRRRPTGEPRFHRHIDPRKRHSKADRTKKGVTHGDILQVNVIGTC